MRINYIQFYRMADVVVGAKLTLDANDGIKSMKDFKNTLKEAKGDLVAMSEQFGVTSDEARKAAKRVAELEDALGDAKQLSDAFNPDKKFAALTQSLQGVLGGFTALTGAMGLLGVESEDVQKQLLKVQSALALGQGLDQVKGSIDSFKTLGKTLVETLGKNGVIGLAIAGVAALGLAISGIFTKKQSEDAKAFKESLKDFNREAQNAHKNIIDVKNAFDLYHAGLVSKQDALKKYNDTLGDTLGRTNDINKAEAMLAANADAYIMITAGKAQANALFAISAQKAAEATMYQLDLQQAISEKAPQIVIELIQKKISELDDASKAIQFRGSEIIKGIEYYSKKFGLNPQQTTTTDKPAISGGKSGGGSSAKAQVQKQEDEELRGLALLKYEQDKALREQEIADIEATKNRKIEIETQLTDSAKRYSNVLTDNYNKQVEQGLDLMAQTEMEKQARIQATYDVGYALGALADLVGKQTAAGKVLAIAQAGINMWLGVTEVLKTKSVLPEPIATISRIANITTVIATGLSAIRNIAKQNVGGGSGGGSVSASAPLQPQAQATNTVLNQNQLNQIGNATTRAFVLETDISNNQERVRRLNRAARLG